MYQHIAILLAISIPAVINENIFDTNVGIYIPHSEKNKVSLLYEAYLNGDTEAGGFLSLAWALGIGTEQDLKRADVHSHELVIAGASRAHTTLALLLRHNLTDKYLTKVERESKALELYEIAAVNGDPLAQVVIGEHYSRIGDCDSAITYYRKAAVNAMQSIQELDFYRPSFVQYVSEEDSPIAPEYFPNQEKLQLFEYLASHGDSDAALEAATVYMSGTLGIQRDILKAEEFLKIAIDGNNTLAMVYQAQLYLRGMSNISGEDAYQLLQNAADYGLGIANSGIGRFYMEGVGEVEKNFEKAEFFLKKGIEAGNVDAFYQLGKLYEIEGDQNRAAELFYLPATIGHIYSSWKLAEFYRSKYQDTTSLTIAFSEFHSKSSYLHSKICEAAIPLYRAVALSGSWKELFNAAYDDYSSNRKSSAFLKYLLLSDLGYSAGHINAARLLEEEVPEVYDRTDDADERSFELWKLASESGLSRGFVKLGDHFYYGKGTARNISKAAINYENAARMKDSQGLFNWALINELGEGVPQNVSKAREIFNQLYAMDPDAEVPVTLALGRLEVMNFINNTFSVDLYKTDFEFIWQTSFYYVDTAYRNWDIFMIILLFCIIIVIMYNRRLNFNWAV